MQTNLKCLMFHGLFLQIYLLLCPFTRAVLLMQIFCFTFSPETFNESYYQLVYLVSIIQKQKTLDSSNYIIQYFTEILLSEKSELRTCAKIDQPFFYFW